jgi:hypothetical protein
MSPFQVIAAFVSLAFGSSQSSGILLLRLRDKSQCRSVFDAVDPFKWAPTSSSMSDTYEVLNNLHMLWKCI